MYRRTLAVLLLCASVTSQAALLGRAPLTPGGTDYQAYYDSELDLTWTADANLILTECPQCLIEVEGELGDGSIHGGWTPTSYLGINTWHPPAVESLSHLYWQEGVRSDSPDPFSNLMGGKYLSGSHAPSDCYYYEPYEVVLCNFEGGRYGFDFLTGEITLDEEPYNGIPAWGFAWNVADGDPLAAVPLPAVAWLLGPAMGLVAPWAKRRVKSRD